MFAEVFWRVYNGSMLILFQMSSAVLMLFNIMTEIHYGDCAGNTT